MKSVATFLLGLLCLIRAAALEPVDLGQGLDYVRIADLSTVSQLAPAPAAGRALVVDLRRPAGSADLTDLRALFAATRPPNAPLFLLVSPDTPPEVAALLVTLPRGVITLGVEGSRPAPAVVVAQPAETDRRAYEAGHDGTALAALVAGRIEKERYDEAALVKEFRNGGSATGPAAPDTEAAEKIEAPPQVLVDRVLQRALHLHRALRALRPRA